MVVRGLLASLQQAARYIGGVTGDLLRSWLQVRGLPPEQHPVFPAGTLIGSGSGRETATMSPVERWSPSHRAPRLPASLT
jgi:hypothetical protein